LHPHWGSGDKPVVVLFSCVNQTESGHEIPRDAELIKMIPDYAAPMLTDARS
jgi:hypothetical protein